MTEHEVEILAQELAKAGGTSWYPGRQAGSLLRVVNERYRAQARVVIETIERIQAGRVANGTVTPDGRSASSVPPAGAA